METIDDRYAWSALIKRYAGDRRPCNCGRAYRTESSEHLYGYCKHGCQANEFDAKDEIAKHVLRELRSLGANAPEPVNTNVPYTPRHDYSKAHPKGGSWMAD